MAGGRVVRATVRVRSRAESGTPPSSESLTGAAQALDRAGLHVVRVGRFGVSVEGTPDAYYQALGVTSLAAGVHQVQPRDAELANLAEALEVATDPTLFRGGG